MRSVTPSDAKAHTSLYDMARGTLLATRALPDNAQLDYASGALYPSGRTPVAALNSAYAAADPASLVADEVRIRFGSDEVTSYLYSI